MGVDCEICGKYKLFYTVVDQVRRMDFKENGFILSGYIRNATVNGKVIKIRKNDLERIIETTLLPEDALDKMDLLLTYIARRAKSLHLADVEIEVNHDFPLVYCKEPNEFSQILYVMEKKAKYLITKGNYQFYNLSFEGLKRMKEIKKIRPKSNQAFAAYQFIDKMHKIFKLAIKPALENENIGFKAYNVALPEFSGKICDEILAQIRKSSLLIADITGQRNAVHFEAGFAMGLGIPVIWTCQEDEETKIKDNFDTRQYKHIIWKDAEDLKKQIINRILGDPTIYAPAQSKDE